MLRRIRIKLSFVPSRNFHFTYLEDVKLLGLKWVMPRTIPIFLFLFFLRQNSFKISFEMEQEGLTKHLKEGTEDASQDKKILFRKLDLIASR